MVKKNKITLKMGRKLVHKSKHTPYGTARFIRKARELGKQGAKGTIEVETPNKKKRIIKF